MKLKGLSALITGGSRGLGLAIAESFLTEGANVLICARESKTLEQAVEGLTRKRPLRASCRGKKQKNFVSRAVDAEPFSSEESQTEGTNKIIGLVADISKEKDVKALARTAEKEFGGTDILVNNAGVYGPMGPLEDLDWKAWVRSFEINLFGTVLTCRAIVPGMKLRKKGKIINLSGGGATAPLPRFSAYAASKAAVVRLTETLAHELLPWKIDVNAVAPGALNTRLLNEVLSSGPEKVGADFYARSLKQKEEGGASLSKGASLCVYLASAASDGVTGRLISAVWDPWPFRADHVPSLAGGDIYTLRRIVPKDRGESWE